MGLASAPVFVRVSCLELPSASTSLGREHSQETPLRVALATNVVNALLDPVLMQLG